MARRGITYGHRSVHPNNPILERRLDLLPSQNVGLLFMAYQNDIIIKFQFTQWNWVNNPNVVKRGVGIDPLVGQGACAAQSWPVKYGGLHNREVGFREIRQDEGRRVLLRSLHFVPQDTRDREVAIRRSARAGSAMPAAPRYNGNNGLPNSRCMRRAKGRRAQLLLMRGGVAVAFPPRSPARRSFSVILILSSYFVLRRARD